MINLKKAKLVGKILQMPISNVLVQRVFCIMKEGIARSLEYYKSGPKARSHGSRALIESR